MKKANTTTVAINRPPRKPGKAVLAIGLGSIRPGSKTRGTVRNRKRGRRRREGVGEEGTGNETLDRCLFSHEHGTARRASGQGRTNPPETLVHPRDRCHPRRPVPRQRSDRRPHSAPISPFPPFPRGPRHFSARSRSPSVPTRDFCELLGALAPCCSPSDWGAYWTLPSSFSRSPRACRAHAILTRSQF